MDTPTIPFLPHREYKFGRHWSRHFGGVSDEVSREKAFEQHRNGDGYTVLILQDGKPVFVVGVNTDTKSRSVVFLEEPNEKQLSLTFEERKPGTLSLCQASRYQKEGDVWTGIEIGIRRNYRFFPDGAVRIQKHIQRDLKQNNVETWVSTTKIDPSVYSLSTPPFGEFDDLLRRDFINLDALEAQCPPDSWVRQGPPPKSPMPIDKAGYYLDDVRNLGLSDDHAENHTLFYLRWLIENNLISQDYLKETAETLNEWRAGKATIREVYRFWGSVLMDDMLSPEANAFTAGYYAEECGGYLGDCSATLAGRLASSYHVDYSEANYQKIKTVLDRRYQEWKRANPLPPRPAR
jgi:hypothetical protein